jgi:uncharacterized membrane protein YkoI
MVRPSVSRRFVGLTLAASVGTGVGLGAAAVWPGSAADARPAPAAITTTAATPAPAGASASSPLTLDQATAIALQASPGRVVEWDQDDEPTGLRYDVTVLAEDGSTAEVEVDAVTGQVTSVSRDNDGE